jgi:hypothetical protein
MLFAADDTPGIAYIAASEFPGCGFEDQLDEC